MYSSVAQKGHEDEKVGSAEHRARGTEHLDIKNARESYDAY